jgi:hypothetical protein
MAGSSGLFITRDERHAGNVTGNHRTSGRQRPGVPGIVQSARGENSCLVLRVVDGKNVFYIADWSHELGRMGVRAGLGVRWWRVSGLRLIADPFVAAAPAGARVRARLRVSPRDEAVLRAAGPAGPEGPGSLPRCAEAGADSEVIIAVGGGDHPHQRGPVEPG